MQEPPEVFAEEGQATRLIDATLATRWGEAEERMNGP